VIGAAGMAWHLAAKMHSEREALSKVEFLINLLPINFY
jgi:hypothetical protein